LPGLTLPLTEAELPALTRERLDLTIKPQSCLRLGPVLSQTARTRGKERNKYTIDDNDGQSQQLRPLLQDDQIGQHPDPVDVQPLPVGTPLVDLRMPVLQDPHLSCLHPKCVKPFSAAWPLRSGVPRPGRTCLAMPCTYKKKKSVGRQGRGTGDYG
jgi:hypothetical protein